MRTRRVNMVQTAVSLCKMVWSQSCFLISHGLFIAARTECSFPYARANTKYKFTWKQMSLLVLLYLWTRNTTLYHKNQISVTEMKETCTTHFDNNIIWCCTISLLPDIIGPVCVHSWFGRWSHQLWSKWSWSNSSYDRDKKFIEEKQKRRNRIWREVYGESICDVVDSSTITAIIREILLIK